MHNITGVERITNGHRSLGKVEASYVKLLISGAGEASVDIRVNGELREFFIESDKGSGVGADSDTITMKDLGLMCRDLPAEYIRGIFRDERNKPAERRCLKLMSCIEAAIAGQKALPGAGGRDNTERLAPAFIAAGRQ